MGKPFVLGRVGVKADGRDRHLLAGPVGQGAACGGQTVRNWRVSRNAALRQVDCSGCQGIATQEEGI